MAEGGAFYAASSVAPEIPERLGGKRRVADGVPNVLMTQIVLDRACIVPITGELVAGAVPPMEWYLGNFELSRSNLGQTLAMDPQRHSRCWGALVVAGGLS